MASCVATNQQRGRTLPPIDKLKTYVPANGAGTLQEIIWKITPLAPAKNYCESKDCKDQITISVDLDCPMPGVPAERVLYSYTGAKDAALACEIINVINMSMGINAMGVWGVDGNNITYRSAYPNLNINIDFVYDSTHFKIEKLAEIKGGKGSSPHLEHGTVAHTPNLAIGDCASSSANMSGRPTAIMPTQDPNASMAAQSYAGIVVDRPFGSRGNSSGNFPFYGDCNDCCPTPDPCVELVCGCCTEVDLAIEGEWPAMVPSKLYYRVAPAGQFTRMGYFAFAPGDGLVEFPKGFSAIRRHKNYLTVSLH